MKTDLWFGDVRSDKLNEAACTILYAIANAMLPTQPATTWPSWFDADDGFVFFPWNQGTPNTWLVRTGNDMLLFVSGSNTGAQIDGVVADWDNAGGILDTSGVALAVRNGAAGLLGTGGTAFFAGINRLRIFGHSLGGMIGYYLNYVAQRDYPIINGFATSYGSPKPGNRAFAFRCQAAGTQRFMMHNDLIPALPPKPEDCPATLCLWFGLGALGRLGRFVHPPVGYQCNADLSATRFEQPIVGNTAVYTYVAGKWFGGQDDSSANHNVLAYLQWFQARVAAATPALPVTPVVPPDQQMPLTARSREQVVRIGEAMIEADVRSPTSIIRAAVVTPIDPATPDRYRPTKIGDLWYITRQGKIIDVGPAKRTAKQRARRMNKAAFRK